MHKRFFPKVNSFSYGVYYLALPLPADRVSSLFGSFNPKDVGFRDGSDPIHWVKKILSDYEIETKIEHVVLITMPSVLGYVFNPVSFYLCFNSNKALISVIAEVHNTYGEQHSYICMNQDNSEIKNNDWFEAEKVFHVSPFLERNGSYKFRFNLNGDSIGIWIDYYDKDNNKQLITSLLGKLSPLNRKSLMKAFFEHPLVTTKAIALIHYQAMKLLSKWIKFIKKPVQNEINISKVK